MPVVVQGTSTPIPTDPGVLTSNGACYKCIPTGLQLPVLIYVLNTIAGTGLTPEQLSDRAACYKCIPNGLQMPVVISLLDQMANG